MFTKPKLDFSKKMSIVSDNNDNLFSKYLIKKKPKFKNSNFSDEYELLESEVLGEGAHAIVKMCKSLKDLKHYAVKIT